MGFRCGIIGLPNVGKSTIFNALTAGSSPVDSYPFTTIEPHAGVVRVPDERLGDLGSILKPEKVIPTTLQFVDIAGLVKDAHRGEGLGNQFLAHIREVDAVAHVVRLFEDPDIPHHSEKLHPEYDIEVIETELLLRDIETLTVYLDKLKKSMKGKKTESTFQLELLQSMLDSMDRMVPVSEMTFTAEEKAFLKDLYLLTEKPVMFIGNIGENDLSAKGETRRVISDFIDCMNEREVPYVLMCGKLEQELTQLETEEQEEFMEAMGIEELGIFKVIQLGYQLLDLVTFFTTESNTVQAWTVTKNSTVRDAGRVIHSDFFNKFIKAEIRRYDDIMELRSEKAMREYGRILIEGRDYQVRDGDVITFRIGR